MNETSSPPGRRDEDPRASRADERTAIRIALGSERVGLLGVRFPRTAFIVAVLVLAIAVIGIRKIAIDDSLSELFRTNSHAFDVFEKASQEFPSAENDVLIVVEGKSLLTRDSVEKLRSAATDLQLIDGVRGIISLFSVREPTAGGGMPRPLFPEQLPEGQDYEKLVNTVMANDLVRGRLVAASGDLALIVLPVEPGVVESDRLGELVDAIRRTMAEDLKGSQLTSSLSGVPIMQLELRTALKRDTLLYNTLGFLAGCGIAILFFRRLSFMIVAAAPPLLAVAFTLGALGWFGFHLNMLLNAMTPLIMVISFSDSMQLTFAARDAIVSGEDRRSAFRSAILRVGPACVLTHVTAGLSFLGLLTSDSALIRSFGEAGVLATAIALFTVLILVPALGVLFAPRESSRIVALGRGDFGVNALRSFCGWIAMRIVRRPGLCTLVDVAVVGGLAVIYAGLAPHYSLADQLPSTGQSIQAAARIDSKLEGDSPIDVLIRFPQGASLYDPESLETIAQVHQAAESVDGIGNVWSLETLRRWLAQQPGMGDVNTLREYVGLLPQDLTRRFISADQKAVVVSARLPNSESADLLPTVNQLNARLDAVRAQHPKYAIETTGLAVISAESSAAMIGRINRALTVEFIFVAGIIGLAFRSLAVMAASFLTGIFPVLAAGALLRMLGLGLQFVSVVALMVSFGLGLSATIHFLNRMWRQDRRDRDPAIAVGRATILVGPALILTAAVLACGLATLMFSSLPSLRLFGWLSSAAIVAALVGDLLILRPAITWLIRLQRARALHGEGPSETFMWTGRSPGVSHDEIV